jgi:hypothetical protein
MKALGINMSISYSDVLENIKYEDIIGDSISKKYKTNNDAFQ